MSATLVLAVGSDWWSLQSCNLILQSAGYTVVRAFSSTEAMRQFQDGDFDLVLLDPSLSKEGQERVTRHIRASGSGIPIVPIRAGSDRGLASTETTPGNRPASILTCVRESLLNSVKAEPAPVFRHRKRPVAEAAETGAISKRSA